jgi:hypothetical protein
MRVASAVGNDVWLNTDLAAKFLIRREVIRQGAAARSAAASLAPIRSGVAAVLCRLMR